MSQGLKPGFVVRVDVRAEAQTYLRSNGNNFFRGKGNNESEGEIRRF